MNNQTSGNKTISQMAPVTQMRINDGDIHNCGNTPHPSTMPTTTLNGIKILKIQYRGDIDNKRFNAIRRMTTTIINVVNNESPTD